MANDAKALAKRMMIIFWIWVGLYAALILTVALAPLVVDIFWLSGVFGVLWIVTLIVIPIFWIWGLVLTFKGSKIAGTGYGLYLALEIIIFPVGIPYAMWDLAKRLNPKAKKEIKEKKEKPKKATKK